MHWPRTLKGRLQLQGQSKPLRSFDVCPVGEVEVGELGDSELVAWCKREDVTLPIPTIPGISLSYLPNWVPSAHPNATEFKVLDVLSAENLRVYIDTVLHDLVPPPYGAS